MVNKVGNESKVYPSKWFNNFILFLFSRECCFFQLLLCYGHKNLFMFQCNFQFAFYSFIHCRVNFFYPILKHKSYSDFIVSKNSIFYWGYSSLTSNL
jgi:hypothetical protein